MGSGVSRRFTAATILAAASAVAAAMLAGAAPRVAGEDAGTKAKPARAPLSSMAYGVLINSWGRWVGPREDGEPDDDVRKKILAAKPAYLRVTTVGNRCPRPEPGRKKCMDAQPGNPIVLNWLGQFSQAGIRLGVGINAYHRKGNPRPVRGVVRHACELKKLDVYGIYDYLFLDFPLQRREAVLQRMINLIHSGRHCSAGGWRLIMSNDTFFHGSRAAAPPSRVWVHAKRFELFDGDHDRKADGDKTIDWKEKARRAASGQIPAILAEDRSYIRAIKRHYPRSHVVLKLEVPHQTGDRFGRLSARTQRRLLKRWAAAQERHGFKMIYPLFVQKGDAKQGYDSRREGTYRLQKRLICLDRPTPDRRCGGGKGGR